MGQSKGWSIAISANLKFTAIIGGPGRLFDTYFLAFGSLSSHAPNWFLSPLALQETGAWRYSDRIAV